MVSTRSLKQNHLFRRLYQKGKIRFRSLSGGLLPEKRASL